MVAPVKTVIRTDPKIEDSVIQEVGTNPPKIVTETMSGNKRFQTDPNNNSTVFTQRLTSFNTKKNEPASRISINESKVEVASKNTLNTAPTEKPSSSKPLPTRTTTSFSNTKLKPTNNNESHEIKRTATWAHKSRSSNVANKFEKFGGKVSLNVFHKNVTYFFVRNDGDYFVTIFVVQYLKNINVLMGLLMLSL